ncbi:hypothetical protein EEL31_09050 [Brevibacillus laterosporus]|nr:hypothetical protein [Brevibacillus laterosporus]TPG68655.1 hypothetical protein EEL31_09050 [Brevibacillus laterosporus]
MLIALQKGDLTTRKDILNILVPYINNSIVGTSKVLYYIAPKYVPIIDSRVIRSWQAFFGDKSLSKIINNQYVKSQYEKYDAYIKYWDLLNNWIDNVHNSVTLREVETMLYGINGNVG